MPACSPLPSAGVDSSTGLPSASRLLVVRHGAGRGPQIRLRGLRPAYCQSMFDDITARWPELARRIEFWETGQPRPRLDDVAAILFLLRDPLAERFPACFADAMSLSEAAAGKNIRLINAPEALSNTIKTRQAKIWREHGLATPPCHPFASLAELYEIAAVIAGPMILKSDQEHSQTRMIMVRDRQTLRQMPESAIALPGSLSPLIDTRAGYRTMAPTSPYATHFHKMRAMVFGDHVQPNHVFFSTSPIVGCVSSSFGHFRSINPIRRLVGRIRCRSHVRCDLDYHYAECSHADQLARAARLLGIEFCAIDYSVHADGRIELWEVNPHFSLHRWPVAVLAGQRKLAERMPRIHDTAARFFGDLVGVKL